MATAEGAAASLAAARVDLQAIKETGSAPPALVRWMSGFQEYVEERLAYAEARESPTVDYVRTQALLVARLVSWLKQGAIQTSGPEVELAIEAANHLGIHFDVCCLTPSLSDGPSSIAEIFHGVAALVLSEGRVVKMSDQQTRAWAAHEVAHSHVAVRRVGAPATESALKAMELASDHFASLTVAGGMARALGGAHARMNRSPRHSTRTHPSMLSRAAILRASSTAWTSVVQDSVAKHLAALVDDPPSYEEAALQLVSRMVVQNPNYAKACLSESRIKQRLAGGPSDGPCVESASEAVRYVQ